MKSDGTIERDEMQLALQRAAAVKRTDPEFPAILRTPAERQALLDSYRRAENDGIPDGWQDNRPLIGPVVVVWMLAIAVFACAAILAATLGAIR